jgi:hypothetical protein
MTAPRSAVSSAIESKMDQLLPDREGAASELSDLNLRQVGSVWISKDGIGPTENASRGTPAGMPAPATVNAAGYRVGIARSIDRR